MRAVWARVRLAFAAFVAVLFEGRLPAALMVRAPAAGAATAPEAPPAAPPDRAIQILDLLQRDGRLVDFLMEDLGAYSDAQIGAAVRDVHAGCRRVLDKYAAFEAILPGREGEPITMSSPIDPAAVRLVGNVAAQPPLRGTLLHRGWRLARLELPPLPAAGARDIVAQAEIEVA